MTASPNLNTLAEQEIISGRDVCDFLIDDIFWFLADITKDQYDKLLQTMKEKEDSIGVWRKHIKNIKQWSKLK